jgi:hypothetical protein
MSRRLHKDITHMLRPDMFSLGKTSSSMRINGGYVQCTKSKEKKNSCAVGIVTATSCPRLYTDTETHWVVWLMTCLPFDLSMSLTLISLGGGVQFFISF